MRQLVRDGILHGIHWMGLMPVFCRLFAGRAVIVMFHEIQRDFQHELMTGTSVDLFQHSLEWLQRQGWNIVSLDECLQALSRNEPQAPRYAVLTFDDGYRDVRSVALPLLEKNNTPFMVYVPTDALSRTMKSWWLGLREIFRRQDHVTIDPMNTKFSCFVAASRYNATFPAATNNNRFAFQLRIIKYFNAYKERVKIEMSNITLKLLHSGCKVRKD